MIVQRCHHKISTREWQMMDKLGAANRRRDAAFRAADTRRRRKLTFAIFKQLGITRTSMEVSAIEALLKEHGI